MAPPTSTTATLHPHTFSCVSMKFEEISGTIARTLDISRFSSLEAHLHPSMSQEKPSN